MVVSANILVLWLLASAAADGRISLGQVVIYMQSAVGVSMIAFGGFSWALDGAAAPVAAVMRREPAMRPAGALPSGDRLANDRAHDAARCANAGGHAGHGHGTRHGSKLRASGRNALASPLGPS